MSAVIVDVGSGVAKLTLNRPDRHNAWTIEMEDDFFRALEMCSQSRDVRAIVVTGTDPGFCIGSDKSVFAEYAEKGYDNMPDRKSVMFMLQIPKPIIAAINGACAGIGFVIASMCDIRFASSDAKMTTSFAQRGLVAEQGLSWMLPRIVGLANSLDLLFSARVFRGEEAERLGFVSRVVNSPDNVVQVAYDYARELAMSCSPSSLASIKRQLYGDYLRTASSALASADIAMKASLAHPDFQEGAKSFLEGRPAEYEAIATAPDSEFADNELDHLLPPNLID